MLSVHLLVDETYSVVAFKIFVLLFISKDLPKSGVLIKVGSVISRRLLSIIFRVVSAYVFQYSLDSEKDNVKSIQYPTRRCKLGLVNLENNTWVLCLCKWLMPNSLTCSWFADICITFPAEYNKRRSNVSEKSGIACFKSVEIV